MSKHRTYRKDIVISLMTKAQNKEEAELNLNHVAHSIHSLNHPLVIGGKGRRIVAMSHNSSNIKFVPKCDLEEEDEI